MARQKEGLAVASPRPRYVEPRQARKRAPTPFENALGDALEAAFAEGVHDLAGVVAALNRSGPRPPSGGAWTEESFEREIARLGDGV
jgi:hypothetical protein